MDESKLTEKVQELTDLELALLVSQIASQHCIVKADVKFLDPLQQEIQLIASNIFGLCHALIQCSAATTLDDFSNGVLTSTTPCQEPIDRSDNNDMEEAQDHSLNTSNPSSRTRQAAASAKTDNQYEDRRIASIVIIRDLNLADENVQIQALELLRTRRIFTHTAFYSASKTFLIVILQSTSGPRLVKHLNDHIFISHTHPPSDGFPNLEEFSTRIEDSDRASISSVVHRPMIKIPPKPSESPLFPYEAIDILSRLSENVIVAAEIKAYLQNIVTFLRLHRAVDSGITPRATKHFDMLVKCLAPLHDLDFVTPSLVGLAARKIYAHRIIITLPENERSMQYGSELKAVEKLLEGVTPEMVVEEVLGRVEAPL